jgi:hypothetical protein
MAASTTSLGMLPLIFDAFFVSMAVNHHFRSHVRDRPDHGRPAGDLRDSLQAALSQGGYALSPKRDVTPVSPARASGLGSLSFPCYLRHCCKPSCNPSSTLIIPSGNGETATIYLATALFRPQSTVFFE